jgi:ubiquinone/menaquinone biosynthesis C-methylase UbiE
MGEKDYSQEQSIDRGTTAAYAEISTYYDLGRDRRGTIKLVEQTELRAICENCTILPDTRVLEVGCGTGRILARLPCRSENTVGGDVTLQMLQHAKSRLGGTGTRLLNFNAKRIPLKSEQFDLTYSFKVLPHIVNVDHAIAEMARVTKKGGTVILEFYNALNIRRFYRYDYYTDWMTPRRARSLVSTESLEIKKIYGAGTTMHLNSVCKIPGIFELVSWLDAKLATTRLNSLSAFYIIVCERC